jgi:hypothetical protein
VKKNYTFLIRYAAVMVLLLVAVIQFFLVQTIHISPWKGGGFGMFSTVGSQNSYFLRVFNTSSSGQKNRIRIPEKFISKEWAIYYLPVISNFTRLKESLLKEKWSVGNDSKIVETDSIDSCRKDQYKPITVTNAEIELWQYKFDINTSTVNSSLLAEY